MLNPEKFIIKLTSLQGIDRDILITPENMPKFIKHAKKAKHKYRKIMEKPIKKKYFLNSSSKTTSSLHKNIQIKLTSKTRKNSKRINHKIRIITIKFISFCRQ